MENKIPVVFFKSRWTSERWWKQNLNKNKISLDCINWVLLGQSLCHALIRTIDLCASQSQYVANVVCHHWSKNVCHALGSTACDCGNMALNFNFSSFLIFNTAQGQLQHNAHVVLLFNVITSIATCFCLMPMKQLFYSDINFFPPVTRS